MSLSEMQAAMVAEINLALGNELARVRAERDQLAAQVEGLGKLTAATEKCERCMGYCLAEDQDACPCFNAFPAPPCPACPICSGTGKQPAQPEASGGAPKCVGCGISFGLEYSCEIIVRVRENDGKARCDDCQVKFLTADLQRQLTEEREARERAERRLKMATYFELSDHGLKNMRDVYERELERRGDDPHMSDMLLDLEQLAKRAEAAEQASAKANEHYDSAVLRLVQECERADSLGERVSELEQVASGNDVRIELLRRKYSGEALSQADAALLESLNLLVAQAFPGPSAEIANLNAELIDWRNKALDVKEHPVVVLLQAELEQAKQNAAEARSKPPVIELDGVRFGPNMVRQALDERDALREDLEAHIKREGCECTAVRSPNDCCTLEIARCQARANHFTMVSRLSNLQQKYDELRAWADAGTILLSVVRLTNPHVHAWLNWLARLPAAKAEGES